MSGALAGRTEAKELNKGRVEATKVRRYWPGKRPDWAKEEEEEEQDYEEDEGDEPAEPAPEAVARTGIAAPVIVKRADDPRLRRLAGVQPGNREEGRQRHRDIAEPQIVRRRERSESEDEGDAIGRMGLSDDEDEEDEATVAERRAAVRERLKQQQQQQEAQVGVQEEEEVEEEAEESEEEEGSSEYTTDDSEDEMLGGRQLMKPVFVPKTDRETIQERELLEKEEEERAEKEKQRLEQRKEETRAIVVQRMQEDAAMAANVQAGPKGSEDIDTDDEKDEEGEYEQWKLREMKRIGRDREEREREVKEAEEKERWRNMSEEERQRWLRLNPKGAGADAAQKKKWRFLQKYWHRGAFFQTEADTAEGEDEGVAGTITRRDFSAPTGEDKLDKSILPEIMQVKNFGRRGRTKWTHLVAEDTTNFESPWAQNDELRMKYNRKMAASDQGFTKPKNLKT